MSLYNDLVRCEFGKGATVDELGGIQNRMDGAVSDLMMGVSAIGNLMFLVADSDEYPEESAKADMYRLGAMLGTVSEVARAMNDTAQNAAFLRFDGEKKNKGSAGK
ncbi:ubiquinol-cytochrome C reductase [Klebsiella quasipneumoniae subsp. similipneumoniae]|uniref:ubiquinol-cytochrome C reductase n=1 Tax=Klebsiella quasipneumoniae TaxID=1463165 RepID=UPI001035F6AD|nr:ubiquinol-cytochrome C reductase [Klebsiella quasipneumoniae]TBO76718.1 ubiquinol-cytochrome C reductase [Klebsiella quasipneumoniae subsp. similipneumoniae]TBO89492.1 ubiquinol-cytochrome C reductase [Klebsiella quasipneumoniae subsp. similipneumoniae]TBO96381.1 ubiquinol-cytochrome C reductase [Klebsiella quasipneumoniae subsp. similipneumoniae]TBP01782.1 ubiquinol-cytochrome C reductase [Klebsiella quasipneumoniae subsp. similipneumoniae]TBP11416.1 ubiquinol-cytochrome C reductase [Klebs